MISFLDVAAKAEKFVTDNSPTLLIGVGVAGTVTTAVLTGKATFKAADILQRERYARALEDETDVVGTTEALRMVWPQYIPAVAMGSITVVSILGAAHIGNRRAAALAAAYNISEKAFTDYKEKVIEKLGETKEQAIVDTLAQEKVSSSPNREVFITDGGKVTCLDAFSGRYFLSDMETLKKAQNDVNYTVNNNMYASLSEFYDKIGLEPNGISDEVGWNVDKMLELVFSAVIGPDDKPVIVVDFQVQPVRWYHRIH